MFKAFVLAVLLASAAVVSVYADGGSPGAPSVEAPSNTEAPGSSDGFHEAEHQFQFNIGNTQVEAEAEFQNGKNKSKLHFQIETDQEGARFFGRFFSESSSSASMYDFKVRFRGLLSFNETNGVAGYQDGVESVVHTYNTFTWNNIQDTTPAGAAANVKQFTAATSDGVLTIVVKINANNASGDLVVTPNDVKIDVTVDNNALKSLGWLTYPNEQVAIMGVLQTRSDFNHDKTESSTKTEEVTVSTSTGSTVSAFSWTNYVSCGTKTLTVASSPPKANNTLAEDDGDDITSASVVYWTIVDPNPSTTTAPCLWDPLLSMQASPASALVASAAAIVFALVAVVLAL